MILLVLDDPNYVDEVLDAWYKLGVSGATIIDSSGFYRRMAERPHMRFLYGSMEFSSKGNMTVIAVVPDLAFIDSCLRAVEEIIGDLDNPNTGIFTSWPLTICKGVTSKFKKADI
ncbi:MAG TPA: hypothetical protein PKX58_09515 [Flexilinea sp.]|nr:hypothetical protein [Flexilinea sp.]HPJ66018.1 hypothetical protein [Flexilinea sp.]HPR72013.1 hypothetical protein [Flexilinea sp.]